ncbi:MAG: hypothetical protein KDE28_04060, partial [Anaerolineales bacterium]|nr:hypothetical protein [Anaerolineales bacterium]
MKLIWRLAIFCLLLFALTPTVRQVSAQQEDATTDTQNKAEAEALWAQLTPAERVGQLFVVSFYGSDVTPSAPIIDLIHNYHIGGVVLQAANDNINAAADAPAAVRQLVTDLQSWALLQPDSAVPLASGEGSPTPEPTLPRENALPLFIVIAQPGDGYPNDQILQGLTPLPNQLAIGATWQPALSRQVGAVLGAELSSLGINLLLGPSLDVASTPAGSIPSPNLSQSFGGHPYWVSQLSQAYVTGVHEGSNGRLLVVPGRLPGQGGSDRPVEQEVATVRKTLAELVATDLLPYLSLTATADPTRQPDGLQLSHLRYQGFQGNVTSATLPLGFDSAAVEELMGLTPLLNWRQAGGLLLSGPLGSQAVERLYDPQGNDFPHRVIAKDAFLAGSDLLLLDSFALGDGNAAAEYANIQDTLLWFQERYATDPSFQQQVDQAGVRILQQKIALYNGDFLPSNVYPDNQQEVGQQGTIAFNVAQNAITLVAPDPAELDLQLPGPPAASDRIIIFSDVRPATQCSTCPEFTQLGVTSLQDRLLELYGPFASGQLQIEQISSFTLADLNTFLNAAG